MKEYYNFQRYLDRLLLARPMVEAIVEGKYKVNEKMDDYDRRSLDAAGKFASALLEGESFNPFILSEEQLQQLLAVKVEDYGDIKLPFNFFCIELGDNGTTFLDEWLEEKAKHPFWQEHPDRFAQNNQRIACQVMFVMYFEEQGTLSIYTTGQYQQQELKAAYEAIRRQERINTGPEALINNGYKVKISELSPEYLKKMITPIVEGDRVSDNAVEIQDSMVSQTQRQLGFLYAFCKFLESENVKTERTTLKSIKKRNKNNLPPLRDVFLPHVILTKKQLEAVHRHFEAGTGTAHGYRYDVRGHFKHFKEGKMAGKIFWTVPHQRGLVHKIYRPAIRKI